jgi:integrase
MRRFISAVFECAIADELAAHDPAARLGALLKPKVSRNRPALRTIEDAQALLHAAEAAPAHPLTKLASRMLAVTAARSYPLRHAEPHEFEGLDGDNPIWRIPPTKMKLDVTQKQQEAFEFIVPLPPQAVEIIKVARQLASGKYVFPNVRYPNKPMSENAISVMYRRLPRFSGRHVPHGWRSTFSTIMNERAEERDRPNDRNVIDLMLAHKPAGVEAIYNRANFMARRRKIAEEWAELLFGSLPPATTLLEGPRR